MPLDHDYNVEEIPTGPKQSGLKKVSSQKSIFDSMPKPPSQEDLTKRVKSIEEKASGYKLKASSLAAEFVKAINDKTLKQNKTVFAVEIEKDLLSRMINLAVEINNDPDEKLEGMGAMSWITLLLKTCFAQRDKINSLEYAFSQIDKKIELAVASAISKELKKST